MSTLFVILWKLRSGSPLHTSAALDGSQKVRNRSKDGHGDERIAESRVDVLECSTSRNI